MIENFEFQTPKGFREQKKGETSGRTVECPPEAIALVMSKVQDIDSAGTAYTQINRLPNSAKLGESLRSILRKGLLGRPDFGGDNTGNAAEDWRENIKRMRTRLNENRQKKYSIPRAEISSSPIIHFNIAGRSREDVHNEGKHIELARIRAGVYTKDENSVAIMFDISSFKERTPEEETSIRKPFINTDRKDYRAVANPNSKERDEEGRLLPSQEMGFVISNRVAPRYFRGIILGGDENLDLVKKVMLKIYKNRPEMLVPIYSTDGGLLWPERKTYSDLKKFITERNLD